MSVRIFKMQREFDWWIWLCPACLAEWLAKGWTAREEKDPPHELPCTGCWEKTDAQTPEGAAA